MSPFWRCVSVCLLVISASGLGCKVTDPGYAPGRPYSYGVTTGERLKGPPKKDKRYSEPPDDSTATRSSIDEDADDPAENPWLKNWAQQQEMARQEQENFNKRVFEEAMTPAKKRTSAASVR
jgi:hypothetical protein